MEVREPTANLERTYTIAEYRSLPEEDEFLAAELVEGRLVREPRPGRRHGTTVVRLARALLDYADSHGGVVTTETGFVLIEDPPTIRGPDVAWVRDPDKPSSDPDDFFHGAPDLAVEVVSPSNSSSDIQQKVLEYFEAGARQVWVVHPRTRSVVAHGSAHAARVLREVDVLDGGELLPGFEMRVAEIFGV